MTGELTLAIAQSPAGLDGSDARLDWLASTLDEHENQMPDLLVLPELFQCGYNIGARVGARAEPQDGPFAGAIALLAREYETAILYGYAERQGEVLFNSAQCIDKRGVAIANHRKLLLPPGFEGTYFTPGTGSEGFTLKGFRVAILVCYDVEFPENLRHVATTGADLVVVPTALGEQWGVVSEKLIPTRAFENGVFVCYANYCGQENGAGYYGGSCIVAPDGSDLVRAGTEPGVLSARLNKSAVRVAQDRLPYHRDRLKLPWVG